MKFHSAKRNDDDGQLFQGNVACGMDGMDDEVIFIWLMDISFSFIIVVKVHGHLSFLQKL